MLDVFILYGMSAATQVKLIKLGVRGRDCSSLVMFIQNTTGLAEGEVIKTSQKNRHRITEKHSIEMYTRHQIYRVFYENRGKLHAQLPLSDWGRMTEKQTPSGTKEAQRL